MDTISRGEKHDLPRVASTKKTCDECGVDHSRVVCRETVQEEGVIIEVVYQMF